MLNPETLMVELKGRKKHRLLKTLGVLAAGAVLFVLYLGAMKTRQRIRSTSIVTMATD